MMTMRMTRKRAEVAPLSMDAAQRGLVVCLPVCLYEFQASSPCISQQQLPPKACGAYERHGSASPPAGFGPRPQRVRCHAQV